MPTVKKKEVTSAKKFFFVRWVDNTDAGAEENSLEAQINDEVGNLFHLSLEAAKNKCEDLLSSGFEAKIYEVNFAPILEGKLIKKTEYKSIK